MKKVLIVGFVLIGLLAANSAQAFATGKLQKAVRNNDINLVKDMIANGSDIDSQEWTMGRTPLMLASQQGNLEIVQVLLQAGAKVDIKSTCGNTALHYAVENNQTEVAKLLYANGANIMKPNKGYATPYALAYYYKNQELIDLWSAE